MTPEERELLRELGHQPIAQAFDAAELPPHLAEAPSFGLDDIDRLLQALDANPEEVLRRAREAWDANLTEDELRQGLIDARMALLAPREATVALQAAKAQWLSANKLPGEFTFPLKTDAIPIEPWRWKYETVRDALGWAVLCGPFVAGSVVVPKAPFRWHSHPGNPSRFVYPMADPAVGAPLSVALFSDFGTGEYQSLYIARQIEQLGYPYAIHLGDVYYAGRPSEFASYFERPLNPILARTKLFTMNANHEMYSGAGPYFRYISQRRAAHANQEQEGSYFCLRSSRFQIIGIDTAYFGHGRHAQPDLLNWLEWVLAEGRSSGRLNILLSSDHPYTYGSTGTTGLFDDLAPLVRQSLIDLWFWGNTHYCALFDRTPSLPFLGSCIGHGGYPYSREFRGRKEPAPLLFLETAARFPAWTNVRQDRGNNGYCVLDLKDDGDVKLRYLDWMGNERCVADVHRTGATTFNVAAAVAP